MSTSSSAQTILIVSDQFVIYSSFIIISMGLIGNILNIIIFTGLKLFRGHPCVFYIIIGSIFDCGTLLLEFTSRIDINVYHYDLTNMSLFWCKMRAMLLQTCMMISLITVCFSSIDQYLSTNHHYNLRKMSTLKLSHYLTLMNICFWILHSIPFGIFYKIDPLIGCTILNEDFKFYFSFGYLFILNGIFPLITSSIFSILSYYNVRRIIRLQIPIIRRKIDRQLTAMVLARVLFLFIVSVPFGIFFIYTLNTSNDTNNSIRISIQQLVLNVTSTLFYFNYAVCYLLNLMNLLTIYFRVHFIYIVFRQSDFVNKYIIYW